MALLKELEAENTKLKKMYAEKWLKAVIIYEAIVMSRIATQDGHSHHVQKAFPEVHVANAILQYQHTAQRMISP